MKKLTATLIIFFTVGFFAIGQESEPEALPELTQAQLALALQESNERIMSMNLQLQRVTYILFKLKEGPDPEIAKCIIEKDAEWVRAFEEYRLKLKTEQTGGTDE